jgi:hypothetical protein
MFKFTLIYYTERDLMELVTVDQVLIVDVADGYDTVSNAKTWQRLCQIPLYTHILRSWVIFLMWCQS